MYSSRDLRLQKVAANADNVLCALRMADLFRDDNAMTVFPQWVVNHPSFSRSRPAFEGKSAAEIFKTPQVERSPEQTTQAIEWLQNAWRVAQKIGVRRTAQVVSRLQYRYYPAGATIFKEGDRGEEFYLILSGAVSVVKQVIVAESHGRASIRIAYSRVLICMCVYGHLRPLER